MSTPDREVVITGMGAVTPLGLTVEETWQGAVSGRSGIGHITLFDPVDHDTKFAGEVKGFDPLRYMERRDARRTDRFTQLAIAAAKEAIADAGLKLSGEARPEVGVIIG